MPTIRNIHFSPAALRQLHRVGVIVAPDEAETAVLKDSIRNYLRGEPASGYVPLRLFTPNNDLLLICHCEFRDDSVRVIDVEVLN